MSDNEIRTVKDVEKEVGMSFDGVLATARSGYTHVLRIFLVGGFNSRNVFVGPVSEKELRRVTKWWYRKYYDKDFCNPEAARVFLNAVQERQVDVGAKIVNWLTLLSLQSVLVSGRNENSSELLYREALDKSLRHKAEIRDDLLHLIYGLSTECLQGFIREIAEQDIDFHLAFAILNTMAIRDTPLEGCDEALEKIRARAEEDSHAYCQTVGKLRTQ